MESETRPGPTTPMPRAPQGWSCPPRTSIVPTPRPRLLAASVLSSPATVPAGTVAGELKTEAANNLGLGVGTMDVLGGHDQPCGALGMGVVGPGRVSDSMGTYECLVACSDQPCLSDIALSASLNSY